MDTYFSHVDTPLFALGLLFVTILSGEGLYILFVSDSLQTVWIAGVVTSAPFMLIPFAVGYWLPRSFVSTERYTRVYYWSLAGVSAFLIVNFVIMLVIPPTSTLQLVSWIRWASAIGAGGGLLIGVFEARGIERAVIAERVQVRAEEAETRTKLLAYLNSILRHEVLNTAGVIQGNAELAAMEYDNPELSERLDTIQTQAKELETVIDDIRILLDASREELDATRVDVTNLLATEITTLRDTYKTVRVETSLPDQAVVSANQALRRVFKNLLQNAVEHNPSDTPKVTVTVELDDGTVSIRIADNGPGIPADKREKLFEQEIGDDHGHGFGLLLTGTLVKSFGGTIELTETGAEGTVFTIEFPQASAESKVDRSLREQITAG